MKSESFNQYYKNKWEDSSSEIKILKNQIEILSNRLDTESRDNVVYRNNIENSKQEIIKYQNELEVSKQSVQDLHRSLDDLGVSKNYYKQRSKLFNELSEKYEQSQNSLTEAGSKLREKDAELINLRKVHKSANTLLQDTSKKYIEYKTKVQS